MSTMLPDNAPVDPDDELLVAYLDGELDAREENNLMNRLLDDQELNQRLQRLQEGWDWLDRLPNATPDEKMVESTLELVVADIVKKKPPSQSPLRKYRWPLGIAAASIIGMIGSLLVVGAGRSNEYRQQLSDLELAENLDAYLFASDIKLMRDLAANRAWSRTMDAAQEVGELGRTTPTMMAETPIDQREQLLEELPLETRAGLSSRWERFLRLDPQQVAGIRKTATAVDSQADAELLLETMRVYAAWREKLPPPVRDGIESDDPKTQRQAIAQAIEITQSATAKRSGDQLDDETVERIFFVLGKILDQRLADGDQQTVKHVEIARRFAGKRDSKSIEIAGVFFGGMQRGRGGRRPSFGARSPGLLERPAPLSSDELELIRIILPPSAEDVLESVAQGDALVEDLVLRNWAEESARRKLWSSRKQASLLQHYNDLSDEERERIDLLPPERMIEELSRRPPWASLTPVPRER